MDKRRKARGDRNPGGIAEASEQIASIAEEPPVINLKERFPRFRVGYEDPAFIGCENPWHFIVECRFGHIAPAGVDLLWACTNKPRSRVLPPMPKKAADRLFAVFLGSLIAKGHDLEELAHLTGEKPERILRFQAARSSQADFMTPKPDQENDFPPIKTKPNSLELKQDGDDGMSFKFHVSDFAIVAEILQPKGV